MPDIDIDFSVRGRERVIRYVTDKYGKESVAQIVTFGKMFPRAATRDAARVLGHDYGAGDRLAKLIPDPIMGRPPSFEDCLKPGSRCAPRSTATRPRRQIVEVAQGLEGIVRNSSIHAAAVVIADRPLTDIVPLQIADAGTDENGERVFRTVTQFTMKPVEQIGLLKMDFLGPAQPRRDRGRARHRRALDRRAAGHGDAAARPRARPTRCCARGDSIGVFQFESEGMREALKKVTPDRVRRPRRAQRAVPARARWTRSRPTPAASTTPSSISYPDERLRPILEATKGVILYQEQAMQIAKEHRRLQRRQGRRPAQGDRQEEPRGDGQAQARVRRRLPGLGHERAGDRVAVDDQRALGRLLLQPLPRRLLRADRLPHRVAEGQLPGRVHGGADLLGDGHQGQGPVLRRPGRADGDLDPAARRQPLRPRVRRRRRQHPLRARRGQGRRLPGGRGDQARPR